MKPNRALKIIKNAKCKNNATIKWNYTYACEILDCALKKLNSLEEIENKLKIPLEIFLKAILNGIWIKDFLTNEIEFYPSVRLCKIEERLVFVGEKLDVFSKLKRKSATISKHGFSWALNKEGLENDDISWERGKRPWEPSDEQVEKEKLMAEEQIKNRDLWGEE